MTVFDILEQLADTQGKNAKIEFLKQHKDNPDLMETFRLAYDGLITYGIKKIPDYSGELTIYSLPDAFKFLKSKLVTREVTGNRAIEMLNHYLSHMDFDDANVIERILQRDLRVGCSGSTANKVWPGLIKEFKISKAQGFKKEKTTWPAFVQLKSDGARAVGIVEDGEYKGVFSSSGRPITVSDKIIQDIKDIHYKSGRKTIHVDGELICLNKDLSPVPRHISNGVVTKAIRGTISDEEKDILYIQTWDLCDPEVYYKSPYRERWKDLTELSNGLQRIIPIESQIADTPEEAVEIAKDRIMDGFEGVIVKNPASPWEGKRSWAQMKIKKGGFLKASAEFRIIDVLEGTGKYEGMMGRLGIVTDDGTVKCNVGTGFKDKDREYFWKNREKVKNTIIEVNYNDCIKSDGKDYYSLYLPVFDRERADRDNTSTFEEVMEELENEQAKV